MDERIKGLSSKLLRTKDPDEAEVIAVQLRSAIHEHIETLRGEVLTLPLLDAMTIQ